MLIQIKFASTEIRGTDHGQKTNWFFYPDKDVAKLERGTAPKDANVLQVSSDTPEDKIKAIASLYKFNGEMKTSKSGSSINVYKAPRETGFAIEI